MITDAVRQSYVGEVIVDRGTGGNIGDGLTEFVENKPGLNMDDIDILGGDSTNVNVGRKTGVIAYIEKKIGRTLNRFNIYTESMQFPQ